MTQDFVYSICGMCTVRCPIQVFTKNGQIDFIKGNPHVPSMKGAVCPRGAAGKALVNDDERPQTPLIRTGERGEGKWRKVSWDEAFDYTAQKLNSIREKYGNKAIALSDRGGPFIELHRAFLRGIGTPNYCNHDASCARNVQHAALSLTGMGRKAVKHDLKNARHVVLQTRNIFEAINVQEVNDLTDALENGCKLTVIDIRANISATKASRYMQIRPGTDYALNLSVIHEIINKKLYNKNFVDKYIEGFSELEAFVEKYTPQWAESETGILASHISDFVEELASAQPSVIWHPGWMTARYKDSFYMSRTIYIINALLGSYGAKGGLPFVSKPSDVNQKGLKDFINIYPKPKEKRADGVGWKYPHFEEGAGLAHLLYKSMETGDPYPIKGYIAYRHDPLMGFPDPDRLRKIWDNLDLLVSVTFSWSDTAWYSDVVLPLSPYLERESIIATNTSLKPHFFVRKRALSPRYDTKADWEIVGGLAKRMNLPELSFDSIEDLWNFQLQGTGIKIEDFEKTGMVQLVDKPIYKDLGLNNINSLESNPESISDSDGSVNTEPNPFKFKTDSGKIEIISKRWETACIPSLKPYIPPQRPLNGQFRLTFGRCAIHTQGHTVNNPMLFEQMPENVLWINTNAAEKLNINDGDYVKVTQTTYQGDITNQNLENKANRYSESIKAKVTDIIHPESVFVIHGFGHKIPIESRAFGKGLADNQFMVGGLDIWDQAGGAIAYQEHFVSVEKA
ncbi:MAG: molybdopterin-dependent oxidoreductase [Desulfamplus sp.]|nr:molybdopterin-dependent oxidoreductase [Desulfamplus sp.]